MREVILPVGPRAAGKSYFVDRVLNLDGSIVLVDRDAMLTQQFGSTMLDPYSGQHQEAQEIVWDGVRRYLKDSPHVRMILDTWNGTSHERREIIAQLRSMDVDVITAWYFVTPVELVEEWFWSKPGVAKMSEYLTRSGQGLAFFSASAPQRDHAYFHKHAVDIESDGFDHVVRIHPLTTDPASVLK